MPYSKAARRAAAIAEHSPEKLYSRNRSLLNASKAVLHDLASGSEKGLPYRKRKRKKK